MLVLLGKNNLLIPISENDLPPKQAMIRKGVEEENFSFFFFFFSNLNHQFNYDKPILPSIIVHFEYHNMSNSLTSDSLRDIIAARLQANLVQVEDMSGGCGQAFAVIIVSPVFQGKNKLARHRLVNTQLKQEIASIHAFTQKSFTPEEWISQGGQL